MTIKTTLKTLSLSASLAASLISGMANAQNAQQGGERRGPPAEAFEACAALVEGDSCSFSGPRGHATGQCLIDRHSTDTLLCAPEGGRPPQGKN